jgi:hypothetical protein
MEMDSYRDGVKNSSIGIPLVAGTNYVTLMVVPLPIINHGWAEDVYGIKD